jgi:phospholipase C
MVRRLGILTALCVLAAVAAVSSASGAPARHTTLRDAPPISLLGSLIDRVQLSRVRHIVVVYEENHSFDNLYGGWEGVNGRANADAAHTTQLNQAGTPFTCLLQNDVNLTSPPLPASCTDTTTATSFASAFANHTFTIDSYIPATATTCPAPGVFAAHGVLNGQGLPGGCTEDLVHRYYQEQYQLNGGQQNRYVTGSDAVGLTMGGYDTTALPIYRYLHGQNAPRYAITDDLFQSAFGGSFLNHQWLIAARTPTWPSAVNDGGASDLHSVVDANGMPVNSPLYTSPYGTAVKDQALTASCTPGPGRAATPPGVTCGDYAVNTIQPPYQPYAPNTAASRRLPPQTSATIGDRLSAAGVSWAWYAGGWSNANGDAGAPGWTNGTAPLAANATSTAPCPDAAALATAVWPNCPDKLFQFHHQPFNYYAAYAPGTAARQDHLRDEQDFLGQLAASRESCQLRSVSFVKPIGSENEHPGYASVSTGSDHLVELLTAVQHSSCAADTMVIVTYDEFGGQWDHVAPPGQGGAPGPHDVWGPGTRIPGLVVSPFLLGRDGQIVDHTQYDTTSIMATIERRWRLAPLGSRDAAVNDLSHVFTAGLVPPRR